MWQVAQVWRGEGHRNCALKSILHGTASFTPSRTKKQSALVLKLQVRANVNRAIRATITFTFRLQVAVCLGARSGQNLHRANHARRQLIQSRSVDKRPSKSRKDEALPI